jgi:hypothetical protein
MPEAAIDEDRQLGFTKYEIRLARQTLVPTPPHNMGSTENCHEF